ncbi:MAG: hypothetical protein F4092_14865 [Rhodospirillaceae bacterium]|nr:hypothetical protein [Rhodospirillaceae bacterium]
MKICIFVPMALVALIVGSPAASAGCPVYPDELKALVYQAMNGRAHVRDVYIGQKRCRLSLALVVGYAASETYARDLGDSIVRLTKSFGAGPAPRKKIGKGIYDFLVGIYRPDETRVALGAKGRHAREIRW